jgi:UDP-N-acetylglucosamine acyltransferase
VIHPSAIVSPLARIGTNVRIGPFCVIGANVEIGDDCVFHSHVVIEGHSKIGRGNEFFPFAAIGGKTQDLKYSGEPTYLEIGDHNVFRENVTVHCGTFANLPTRIGSHNLMLCYAHVAHDCQLGNHIILSNSVGLAGHVIIEDHVIVSGLSGVHQFCRIGQHAIVGGFTKITQDVPPFMIVDGNPGTIRGVNTIGLQRRGFSEDEIRSIKNAYKKLFLKKDSNLGTALSSFKATLTAEMVNVKVLVDFIEKSERGVTR